MRILGCGLIIISIAMLCGCASTSELANKPVQLQPGQGIAAIVLDAPNRITQIKYTAKGANGSGFEVPDTKGGPSLYLVPVQAGRYCLQHFRYWRTIFDSVQDLGCFTAVAGQITYAGTIVPSHYLSGAQTDQTCALPISGGAGKRPCRAPAGGYGGWNDSGRKRGAA